MRQFSCLREKGNGGIVIHKFTLLKFTVNLFFFRVSLEKKNFHTTLRDALIGATCKEIPGSVQLRRPATIYTPRDTRLQSGTTEGSAQFPTILMQKYN